MNNYNNIDIREAKTNLLKNSLQSEGAKPIETIRKRKRKLKANYKIILRNAIIIFTVIAGVKIGGKVVDSVERRLDLNTANDYMNTKIVSYLEKSDLDYVINKDKKLVILDSDSNKINILLNNMKEDGFNINESIYGITKNCDKETINKILKTQGYENIDYYLYKNYPSGELSNNGSTYLYKHGDEKVFENNVELNYINHVQNLQDNAEKVIEENKGMVR